MAGFTDRQLYLVKKALAIAVLAIERQDGPFQSTSDQAESQIELRRRRPARVAADRRQGPVQGLTPRSASDPKLR
jgi:hypothetical protein